MQKVSQKEGILKLLKQGISVDPKMAMQAVGSMRLAAIIHDLRHNHNLKITTTKQTSNTGNRFAVYTLVQ